MVGKDALFRLAETLGGLAVLGCLDGSPAARAGIRYGDVLLSVNGRRTHTLADFVEAKAESPADMEVVVFRDGREVSWRLAFDTSGDPPDLTAMLVELAAKRLLAG